METVLWKRRVQEEESPRPHSRLGFSYAEVRVVDGGDRFVLVARIRWYAGGPHYANSRTPLPFALNDPALAVVAGGMLLDKLVRRHPCRHLIEAWVTEQRALNAFVNDEAAELQEGEELYD